MMIHFFLVIFLWQQTYRIRKFLTICTNIIIADKLLQARIIVLLLYMLLMLGVGDSFL